MYLVGYDIGSSSVKACVVDAQSGKSAAIAAGSTKCGFPNGAAELWMEKVWNYRNV